VVFQAEGAASRTLAAPAGHGVREPVVVQAERGDDHGAHRSPNHLEGALLVVHDAT
jgi:hypothetical protein